MFCIIEAVRSRFCDGTTISINAIDIIGDIALFPFLILGIIIAFIGMALCSVISFIKKYFGKALTKTLIKF
jgi:H+/Cl- antiporter ClcA